MVSSFLLIELIEINILFNQDGLIKRLDDLERNEMLYKGLIEHCKKLLKSIMELSFTHKTFGDIFSSIGAREPQPKASESFSKFGDSHRQKDKSASGTVSPVRSILRF